jgi:hypothetical protein
MGLPLVSEHVEDEFLTALSAALPRSTPPDA